MKYIFRECPLKFHLEYGNVEGSQTCHFELDGEKYSWWLSYAMGSLFGSMLNAVYGLLIEIPDDKHITYERDDSENERKVTGVTTSSTWDNEGEQLKWTFRRDLNRNDWIIDMTVDYQFGKKVYKGQIELIDLCYAITSALTDYIKQIGFCCYHFASVDDSIEIVRFLILKHYALTGEIKKFYDDDYGNIKYFSFEEEMDLIKQSM